MLTANHTATQTNADLLLAALKASPMTVAQLIEATNLNPQVVRRNLRSLRNDNVVRAGARKDKETKQIVWRLIPNRKARRLVRTVG